MLPNSAQSHQDGQASLPPVNAGQPPQPVPVTAASPALAAPADAVPHYAARVKQVVAQYSQDPYQLGEALSRLKAAYLAEQHHITSNEAGT